MSHVMRGNTVFYGDNLEILRDYFIDACVDPISLDLPFYPNCNDTVLFIDEYELTSEANISLFEDTSHWAPGAEQIVSPGCVEREVAPSSVVETTKQANRGISKTFVF